MRTLTIDCDDCTHQHTPTCADCVVTYICDQPAGAVVVDLTQHLALRRMSEVGLVPELRHHRRSG